MKVAVYYNNNDIRVKEISIPEIHNGEILVKVMASGICGTDVMEWYRIKRAPRILGHEIAGEIVKSRSGKFMVGERVFVSHHVPCGECKYCLSEKHTACEVLHRGNYDPGGYSEFIRVPALNVNRGTYVLPEEISYEEGTMVEPLACALRGQKVIDIKEGDVVLILGSGVSGLLNIQVAKLRKASRVIATDIVEYRLQKAARFGAEIINANQNFDLKADKIIVCTPAIKAVERAFKCIDRKGTILFFAIPEEDIRIPTINFWRDELTVTSSYGAAPRDLEESLELIKEGRIRVQELITHRLSLDEIQKAFQIAMQAGHSLKIVLLPNS